MKKYFIISDIHGFFKPMHKALFKAGFRKNNTDHILIVCGDIFDRGPDAVKVYKFIRSLPKSRRILIRGNHEFLLRDAIARQDFLSHDIHNRTDDTVKQFIKEYYPGLENSNNHMLCHLFQNLGILRWIFSDEWVNYYELGKYIFVHGWIPIIKQCDKWGQVMQYRYKPSWRHANLDQWEESSWLCPWYCYQCGLFPKNKIIVCGHWHTSDFRNHLDSNSIVSNDNSLYIHTNIIGLDACTVLSHFCNVLILNDKYQIENLS